MLGGRSGHSNRSLRRQKHRDNLTHLLSFLFLINSHPLFKVIVGRLTTIYWMRAAKRVELETLQLMDGSAMLPDYINNLFSLGLYANL